jgi:hypothetical protein
VNINKTIIKILSVAIILIGSISLTFPNLVSADLGDPNDLFIVQSPSPNTKIQGNVSVSLRIFDNDQSQVQYQAGVFDAATCRTSHYGNINPTSNATSHPVQSTVFTWNTSATQSMSSLPDGEYCLKICAYFLNGSASYSACNGRNLTIVNSNRPPVINSAPQTLQINSGASFQYQIQASDPDSDTIRYRLVAAPAGFSINPNTGLVSSVALTAPANTNVQYNITVAAGDNISGEATQSFVITVIGPVQQPTEPGQGGEQPEPDSGEEQPDDETPEPGEEEPEEIESEFITPNDESVFTDEFNLIKWQVDPEDVSEITLEYSDDLENWTLIGDPFPPTRDYYLWDITGLEDGEYYLRLGIIDEEGNTKYITSESFELAREISNDPDQIESNPLIVNITPESGEEILLEDLTISGEFVPSESAEMLPDTFTISLDDNDISDSCTVDEVGFTCEIPSDLEPGLHSLVASIDDSSEQTATFEWTFTITDPDEDVSPDDDENEGESDSDDEETVMVFGREIPRSGFILMLIILCAGAALLIIPWILYAIWSRDNDDPSDEVRSSPDDSGSSVTTTTTITPNQGETNQETPPTEDSSYTELIQNYQPDTAYDLNAAGSDYSYKEPTPQNTNTVIDYQMPAYSAPDSTETTNQDYSQPADTQTYEQAQPQQNYADYGMPTQNLSQPVEPQQQIDSGESSLADSINQYTPAPQTTETQPQVNEQADSQPIPSDTSTPQTGQTIQQNVYVQPEQVTPSESTEQPEVPAQTTPTQPDQNVQQQTQYPDLSQIDFQIPSIDMGGQQPSDVTQQQVNTAVEETQTINQPNTAGIDETTQPIEQTGTEQDSNSVNNTVQSQDNLAQTPPDSVDQYTEPPKHPPTPSS